jgi:hypothetical protein
MSNQDIIEAGEMITEEINSGNYAHLKFEELVQIIVKEFAGLLIEFTEQPYIPDFDPDIDEINTDNIPW